MLGAGHCFAQVSSTVTQALLLAMHESNVHFCEPPLGAATFGFVAGAVGFDTAEGGVLDGVGVGFDVDEPPALRSAAPSCVLSDGSLEHPMTAPRPARVRVTMPGVLSFIEKAFLVSSAPVSRHCNQEAIGVTGKSPRIRG
jgi:hypothetical protein